MCATRSYTATRRRNHHRTFHFHVARDVFGFKDMHPGRNFEIASDNTHVCALQELKDTYDSDKVHRRSPSETVAKRDDIDTAQKKLLCYNL